MDAGSTCSYTLSLRINYTKMGNRKKYSTIPELKRLAEVFQVPLATLTDKIIELPKKITINFIDIFYPYNNFIDPEPHHVYDANLIKQGRLHRFMNPAGVLYSTIYVGSEEMFSCERSREENMINYWNEG